MRLVMKKKGKHKSATDIGASLTLDYREKEENNIISSIFQQFMMEKYESIDTIDRQQRGTLRFFTGWVLIAQVLGLISVVMVAVWMGHFRGGFAWTDDPKKEFNYHPLFMIIGMVFLYGNSILVYRVFRNNRKIYVKILHAGLHILALIFAAVGLKAVFDSHNLASPPMPNLYSLHSWLGLGTVILFALQWVFGFLSFLKPGLPMELRRRIRPTHIFVGLAIFFIAIATALTGIMEKTLFSLENKYSHGGAEAMLINFLAVTLVLLGVAIGYIVTNPSYQRQALPEEEHLQLSN